MLPALLKNEIVEEEQLLKHSVLSFPLFLKLKIIQSVLVLYFLNILATFLLKNLFHCNANGVDFEHSKDIEFLFF